MMRRSSVLLTTLFTFFVVAATIHADDYLTKDGKLTHALKITQLQGGFAGFTGFEYAIEPDGSWTMSSVFKQKATVKEKGKLTAKQLASLADVLAKNQLDKLPEKTGKQAGANPFTLAITFGKTKTNYVGQTAPKLDGNNPTPESRTAAIYSEVVDMIKGAESKKAPS